MDKTHYDSKYYTGKERIPAYLSRTISGLLKKHCASTILEVGCGTGHLLGYLSAAGFSCYGCDISFFAARACRQINASASEIPFRNGSMDAVLSISVIEHLDLGTARKFLKEARRVLKTNGVLFLVTPNKTSVRSLIFGANRIHSGDPTHVFFYSPASLARVLREEGFGNIHSRFPYPKDCSLQEWALPKALRSSESKIVKDIINWMMISSPLGLFRDSFWIAAQKV